MHSMFKYCNNLNQPFDVPYYATEYDSDYDYAQSGTAVSSCAGYVMFAYCYNLNSMVTFNDYIESMCGTFEYCDLFNQNVVMPSHLKYSIDTFSGCNESFNQNIAFPETESIPLNSSSIIVFLSLLSMDIFHLTLYIL